MQLETATAAVHTIAKVGAIGLVGVPVLSQVIGIKEINQTMLVQPLFWVGLAVLTLLALSSRIVLWKLKRADTQLLTQDSHTNLAFATKDDVIEKLRLENEAYRAESVRRTEMQDQSTASRIAELTKERDSANRRANRLTKERNTYYAQAVLLTEVLKLHKIPLPEFTHTQVSAADEASSITRTLDEASENEEFLEEISEELL